MSKDINLNVRRDEAAIIGKIAQRAAKIAKARRIKWKVLDFSMDVTACHANGCSLRLNDLLGADDFNFIHDVFGIRNHLNRETGRLEHHFLPRFRSVIGGTREPVEMGVGAIPEQE